MAGPIIVELDGTRVNDSTVNTNWGNWNTGGGAPASEPQIAYQGGSAVNKKITNTSTTQRVGLDYDPGAAPVDMTSANNYMMFAKINITDSFDLQPVFGCELGFGDGAASYYSYVMAGSQAARPIFEVWPAQSGYLLAQINPNVVAWRDSTVGGGVTLTAVDYWAAGMSTQTGGTKDINFAFDSIDVGRGLRVRGGGVDGAATGIISFENFLDTDQNFANNRWGVIKGSFPTMEVIGLLLLGHEQGTAAAKSNTRFSDSDSIITFKDGYHASNNVGVVVWNANTNDSYTINSLLIGAGSNTENLIPSDRDTRPDFTVVGTANSAPGVTIGATMRNFRNINLNASVAVDGATLECERFFPNSEIPANGNCTVVDSTILTKGVANSATLQDFPDNNSTDIQSTTLLQAGTGHGAELATVDGSYQLTNMTFTDYNALNGQGDSALLISAATGTTTINLSGTTTPTYLSLGANVVFVAAVSVTVSNMTANTELRVFDDDLEEIDPDYQIAGVEDVSTGFGEQNGTASGPDANGRYSFNFSTGQNVNLKLRFVDTTLSEGRFWTYDDIEVSSGAGTTLSIQAAPRPDRVFNNP